MIIKSFVRYYFLFCFILFTNIVLQAQGNQVLFDHITAEDGLSEAVINCIFQDSKGFMWFGTNDGLNRYDGYNFTVFKPSPDEEDAINSNLIYAITEDHNGHIWIGTTGAGLNRFDPVCEKFTAYRHDENDLNSLDSDQITSAYTDSKGRIWVGTLEGLNLLIPNVDENESPLIHRISLPRRISKVPRIRTIQEDRSGNMWIGTRSGLFHCIPRGNAEKFEVQKINFDDLSPSRSVSSLAIDANGMLLVGTTVGLYQQTKHGAGISFQRVSDVMNQQAMVVDNLGKVWAGTYNGLLCFQSPERNTPLKLEASFVSEVDKVFSLNKNVIKSLYKDKTGVIWVGTNGGGVNKFNPGRKKFYHYGNNLSVNGSIYKEVRSIFEDSKGNLWVGTEGGGLFFQKAKDGNNSYGDFERFKSKGTRVFALEEIVKDGKKYLLVGSEDFPFLEIIDFSKENPTPAIKKDVFSIKASIFSLLQDHQKTIWIGTYNGRLHRWIPRADGSYDKTVLGVEDGMSSKIIRKVFEDSKGHIWIGTAEGLDLISLEESKKEKPKITSFKHTKEDQYSLSHNYISEIYEDARGQLWIGTYGGGLNKLVDGYGQASIQFKRYTEKDGLPNNSVKSIEEDIEGNLWLGTNHGLTKFNPNTEKFENYTVNDGLQASEFLELASTQRANGELLFGGVNGFNAFYPDNIKGSMIAPEVVFTKLWVNNEEVHPEEKIDGRIILKQSITATKDFTLKYKQSDFSIEFAALHYAAPKENSYEYKLEGYHNDWIATTTNKRAATFTSLPPGNYTLLVKASNGDGVWTDEPAKLNIKIQPPFWLTWYAYLLYAALLGLALWLFRRYTVISVHEKHQLTLDHMERDKLEELNQMKLRFFTNISHELRTPLTLIIAPLEHILEKGKSISPDRMQQQYHYMYKNAKYLLRLVNQLLDFRKLDQGSLNLSVAKGDILAFTEEITEPFQFLANKKNIVFKITDKEDSIYTHFDPDIIEKVLYNLLSNAFKFTQAGGEVKLSILEKQGAIKTINGQYIEIRVDDTGSGISKVRLNKIFERFYKEGSKKENKDGAGIGLAYTKSLVELHRGTIEVESKKGEGSCFIVRLPMEKKAYLKSEIDQSRLEKFDPNSDPLEYLVAEPISSFGDATDVSDRTLEGRGEELPLLLFVDDNSDIRRFIKEGFQNDFRIIEAEDGEKGYEIALASLPDIIVSDVMMPNMNGFELCEALKTNHLTSHIPVVLLTAKSASEDELEGLQTGADAYVVKPFKLDILRTQLLNIHLHRERLRKRFRQEVILEPEEIAVTSADEEFLKKAVSIIEDHMSDSEFNVEALVKEMYISRSKLYLKLKALTGQSTSEFMRTVRLKRAVQLLEKSDYTIKEIMYMTGFNTASYFSKCFKKQFGVVPSEYLESKKTKEHVGAGLLSSN
ncbi:MAG: two-component regulator propeller domain-containing protein [Bacteroidota bacterium]